MRITNSDYEYSHKEIADLMGVSIKEVKELERTALSKIELLLADYVS